MSHTEVLQLSREVLGAGSYGKIRHCSYSMDGVESSDVVAKLIEHEGNLTSNSIVEAYIMSSIQHENINSSIKSLIHSFKYRNNMNMKRMMIVQNRATGSLADYRGTLSVDDVMNITISCLRGLDSLHRNFIIHCDVKPHNILYYSSPVDIKLTDFSLSTFAFADKQGAACSRGYAPPELLCSSKWGAAIDVWSLGCTIYEIFNRRPLFPEQDDDIKMMCCIVDWCKTRNNDTYQNYDDILKINENFKKCNVVLGEINKIDRLVSSMLLLDPNMRPTTRMLLQELNSDQIPYSMKSIIPREVDIRSKERIYDICYKSETISDKLIFYNFSLSLMSRCYRIWHLHNMIDIEISCVSIVHGILDRTTTILHNTDVENSVLRSVSFLII